MHWPRIRGLCSVSWCLAEGQWNGDQRRPMGRKAREGLYSLCLYSNIQVLHKLRCSLDHCNNYNHMSLLLELILIAHISRKWIGWLRVYHFTTITVAYDAEKLFMLQLKIHYYYYYYNVSTKKLYPCIHCHNSGKQRRILTKFNANTEMLNCKQVTKFQQNQ